METPPRPLRVLGVENGVHGAPCLGGHSESLHRGTVFTLVEFGLSVRRVAENHIGKTKHRLDADRIH